MTETWSSGTRGGLLLAATAGLAVAHAGPGITAIRAVRIALFPRLSGSGLPDHVALTFDDGPDQAATPLFLDLLRERGVRATFFLIGSQVSKYPRLAADIADAGHEIGVHGWRHRYLPLRGPVATQADLARTKEIITATAGVEPWLFRPPYGVLSTAALIAARRLGLTPVLWNCWGREWTPGSTPESVYATLTGDLAGGATVLLHDSDCTSPALSWQAALGALRLLLDECGRRGLRAGPLGEHGPHWHAPAAGAAAQVRRAS
ncbi:MAG TPA: polysaccharide deacetylase family protein [Streptosporangiaceae bacterium]|nr:polysaccharide deacetylase family protein [Streptosporangiaceae bacterium]